MIVATFQFRGHLFVVTEFGDVYRIVTNGSGLPIDWKIEKAAAIEL